MSKALKQKLFKKLLSTVLLVVIVISAVAFLFPANYAEARNVAEGAGCVNGRDTSTGSYAPGGSSYDGARVCDFSSIVLTTNATISGQGGNYIKVGPSDSITIDVNVVLSSPPDLNVGTQKGADQIYFPSPVKPNNDIEGFGATVTAQDTSTFCGTIGLSKVFKCDSKGQVGTNRSVTTSSGSFTSGTASVGPYDKYQAYTGLTKFTSGSTVFQTQIIIPASDFDKMGIKSIKDTPSGNLGLNELFVYPDVLMNYGGVTGEDYTTLQPATPIFVQRYATDAAKNADASTPPTCQGSADFGKTAPVTCVTGATTQTSNGINAGGGVTSGIANLLNAVIGFLLGLVQEFLYAVFSLIIAPFIEAVLKIHPYQDSFVAVIYPGWIVIRNLCNIFFILALIIIAMATLFRIDSYKYRDLLVQLIIAALLINFSLVIAQAVLGLADTVQAQFFNDQNSIKSLAGSLMLNTNSGIIAAFNSWAHPATTGTPNINAAVTNSSFANIIQSLVWLSLSLGTFVTFFIIAIFLLIRIVALWVLLLISPIAYAVGVLPTTAGYRDEWWNNFMKYAFFTPIMAFFLRMAAVMADNAKMNPIFTSIASSGLSGLGTGIGSLVTLIASNVLIIVFLLAGLMVADKFGIMGASALTGAAKKATYLPFLAAGGTAKAAAGAFGRSYTHTLTKKLEAAEKSGNMNTARLYRAAQFLNPHIAAEAYKQRVHEKEEEAYEPAIGYTRDTINRVIPSEWHMEHGKVKLGQKTYYGRIAQANMIAHKRSEWEKAPLSEEERVRAAMDAHHIEDVEAIEYVLMDNRHEDGMAISWMEENGEVPALKEKMRRQLAAQGMEKPEIERIVKDYGQAHYNKIKYTQLLVDRMKHAGMTNEQIGEKLSHLQEHAEGENKERGLGYALWEWDKQFRAVTDFSGYEKLAKKDNKKFLEELAKTGAFDKSKLAEGKLIFKIQNNLGEDIAPAEEITDWESFEKVRKSTEERFDNPYYYGWHADMGNVIAGARANMDAQKRKERGSSERWSSNIEPAAVMTQFADGKFRGLTSYGVLSVSKRPRGVVTSLQQTRVIQDRAMKIVGIYKDEETGKVDLRPAAEGGSIDYDSMANEFLYNHAEASALISRAGLGTEALEDIKKQLLTNYRPYLRNIPKYKTDDPTGKGRYKKDDPILEIKAPSDRVGATFSFEEKSQEKGQVVGGGGPTAAKPDEPKS